jgi:hypothetical protein
MAIGFYLGSDTLRRYTQADFRTTFESHCLHPRGIRLVLYDAQGDFDRDFVWWNRQGACEPELPIKNGRTDLLIGSGSRMDIHNINLLATLLVTRNTRVLVSRSAIQSRNGVPSDRHILAGLLAAP